MARRRRKTSTKARRKGRKGTTAKAKIATVIKTLHAVKKQV